MVRLLTVRFETMSNVKLNGFRSRLQASYVSSQTEELWYNETVCLWMTMYMCVKSVESVNFFFFFLQAKALNRFKIWICILEFSKQSAPLSRTQFFFPKCRRWYLYLPCETGCIKTLNNIRNLFLSWLSNINFSRIIIIDRLILFWSCGIIPIVVFWPSTRPKMPFQGDAPEGRDTF